MREFVTQFLLLLSPGLNRACVFPFIKVGGGDTRNLFSPFSFLFFLIIAVGGGSATFQGGGNCIFAP